MVSGTPVTHQSTTVLIVDDHPDSAEMYALSLDAMGLVPLTASTAAEAFMKARERHPDAIVVDLTLPDASGLELTRRLRSDVRTTSAGIIVLTGDGAPAVEREAYKAGCDRFLLKPCLPDALAATIWDVLAARSHGS